jgi:RNA recognition motif-containing protein
MNALLQKVFILARASKLEFLLTLETNAKVAAKKKTSDEEEPAATIYVENLPDEANESMLNLLFSQFPGFKKSRPIPAGGKGFFDLFSITGKLIF